MTLKEGWDAYTQAVDRWKLGDLDAAHEGGESYAQIRQRVVRAFVGLARDNPGSTIVVVAHGVVIRVLLTSLLEGHGPEDFERFGIDFVAVNNVRFDGQTWRAETLNGLPVVLEGCASRFRHSDLFWLPLPLGEGWGEASGTSGGPPSEQILRPTAEATTVTPGPSPEGKGEENGLGCRKRLAHPSPSGHDELSLVEPCHTGPVPRIFFDAVPHLSASLSLITTKGRRS